MKALLLVFSVLGAGVFYAYLNFKPYTNYLEMHVHFKDSFGEVNAAMKMDSFFSTPAYKALKENEYKKILLTKDLTRPFTEETIKELYRITKPYDDVDRELIRNIFRAALVFRAIDENNLPNSKDAELKVIFKKYDTGITSKGFF